MLTLLYNTATLDGSAIRQETLQGGRVFSVLPTVMMVEGVRIANAGPILYRGIDGAQSANLWNGLPVTLNHPGLEESARTPAVVDRIGIGTIYNVAWHAGDGTKPGYLAGETWIENSLLAAKDPALLLRINNKETAEVSIGLTAVVLPEVGMFASTSYVGVATEWRPDHLAILNAAKGSCNVEAGCGAGAAVTINNEAGCSCNHPTNPVTRPYSIRLDNASGITLDHIQTSLRRFVDTSYPYSETPYTSSWVEEIFLDYFVVGQRTDDPVSPFFWKYEYSIATGEVVITSAPVRVRRNLEYIPLELPMSTTLQNTAAPAAAAPAVAATPAPAAATAAPAAGTVVFNSFDDFMASCPPQFAAQAAELVALHNTHRATCIATIKAHAVGAGFNDTVLQNMETNVLEGMAALAAPPVAGATAAPAAAAPATLQNAGAVAPAAAPQTLYVAPAAPAAVLQNAAGAGVPSLDIPVWSPPSTK